MLRAIASCQDDLARVQWWEGLIPLVRLLENNTIRGDKFEVRPVDIT